MGKFKDRDQLANSTQFVQAIRIAMIRAAVVVQSEDPGGKNFVNRSNYARLVLNSPNSYAPVFATVVAADPNADGISIDSADADLTKVVLQIWDALAGVV